MSDVFYMPLTPELRNRINSSIDGNILELHTCKPNAFVNAQTIGYKSLKSIINTLPDGYPIPMERRKY